MCIYTYTYTYTYTYIHHIYEHLPQAGRPLKPVCVCVIVCVCVCTPARGRVLLASPGQGPLLHVGGL